MELLDSLRWRYATKQFDTGRSLNDDQVRQLLEATNLSATSFGLQPFKLLVLRDQAKQDQLVASSWNQNQVAEASHVIVIATRTDIDADYITSYVDMMESQRELPSGTLDQFKQMAIGAITAMNQKSLDVWATKQAYIALGTLLAACATAKIDACPMEGFLADEYDEKLGLSAMNLRAAVVIPIGYRAAQDKYQNLKKVRRDLDDIVVKL